MTDTLTQFCQANPTDRRVVAITKLLNGNPFNSIHTAKRLGKLIGELSREVGA